MTTSTQTEPANNDMEDAYNESLETSQNEEIKSERDEATEDLTASPIEPPQHWSGDYKEMFKKQPKDAQEFILSRHKEMEADYTRKTQELSKQRKLAEAVEESLNPYRNDFELHGIDEAAAVKRLLAVHGMLKQNPEQGLIWLAEQYGFRPPQETATDEFIDPTVAQLKAELSKTQAGVNRMLQAQQQQSQNQLLTTLNNFVSDPKNPHATDVKTDIVNLYQSGVASSMEEAYNMAVAKRPELRDKVMTARIEAAKLSEKSAKEESVRKAKKAASGIRSTSASVTKGEAVSQRDYLSKLYDELST